MLKTVENAGVSHVKQSEQYTKKLESEFKALNFPYRPEAVSMISMMHIRTVCLCVVKHQLLQSYFSIYIQFIRYPQLKLMQTDRIVLLNYVALYWAQTWH